MLKPVWLNIFRSNVIFGFAMILLAGIPRFIIVLNANISRNYNLVSAVFIFMWIVPFIFLTRAGRKEIGITKPSNYTALFFSFITGILFCALMFVTAKALFGHTFDNWFVYISQSYLLPPNMSSADRAVYFVIFSMVAITFSPIGEELFYRGIVHNSFSGAWGDQKASIADSAAFALTHLAHFGIVYLSGTWKFLFFPALLWVIFMFVASRIFFLCRQKTDSILGAIISHAGYNFAMMYFIFYQ